MNYAQPIHMEVNRNAYSVLEGKSAGKSQLGRPRSRRVA